MVQLTVYLETQGFTGAFKTLKGGIGKGHSMMIFD